MKQPIAVDKTGKASGQALVEYMLAILLCIGVAGSVNTLIKRGIARIWLNMAKDIAAGCPGCDAPEQIR